MERYIKTVEEHLWKIIVSYQMNWKERLPLFLLAYWASTQWHLRLDSSPPSFGARTPTTLWPAMWGTPPDKEWPTTDHAANLVGLLHDIQYYAHQHLKLASDWMRTWSDKLANSTSYQEGKGVWIYRPTRKREITKTSSLWEGPYKIVTWINDVVYKIQKNPRTRMMVVHLDWSPQPVKKLRANTEPERKKTLQARSSEKRNSDTPLGYSPWTALRREQCDEMPESLNKGVIS
jgi:hypothetical protein